MAFVVALISVTVVSMYLAGRVAERRGRSVKAWLWLAALAGPVALVVLLFLPPVREQAAA